MITLDPSNPVVVAIGRGMQAEIAGTREVALAAYTEAWNSATDDFERCIAAHYVPRMIDDPQEKLRWNEDALRLALAVGDDRVAGFFASLYANVAQCRLGTGDTQGAQEAFRQAEGSLVSVPNGPYKDGIIAMINSRKQRT
jgi:hypothetical protein